MLENSKQSWVILTALENAGEDGLSLIELRDESTKISVNYFNTDTCFNTPTPAMRLLRRLVESGGIQMFGNSLDIQKICITSKGIKGLRLQEKITGVPLLNITV